MNELDTSSLVVAVNWSVSKEWKAFKTLTESFELHSQWNVQQVTKWTNGKCEWAEYTESNNTVKGKLVGKFSRGIYANLKLETFKKLKYAQQINELRNKMDARKIEKARLLRQREAIREEHEEHIEQLEELGKYIADKREEIKHLSQRFMTLDEARERLKKLKELV